MSDEVKKKNDLRFKKAEHAIRTAFTQLLIEKGYETITISEIVETADIRRATFYLHYKSKEELLNNYQEEFLQGMKDIINNEDKHGCEGIESITQKIFAYIEPYRQVLQVLFSEKGSSRFRRQMKKLIWYDLFQNALNKRISKQYQDIPQEYIFSFIEHANQGILYTWLNSEPHESPEEITKILLTLTFKSLIS